MTNKNITALTATTTPLTGTELVPVVQSGETKKVTVDSLTAGKSVSVNALIVGANGVLPTNGYNLSGPVYGGAIELRANSATTNRGWRIGRRDSSTGFVAHLTYLDSDPVLRVVPSTAFTADVTLSAGNLVQGTAAKGINFTANTPAAGMTSQLLNWYEEGTYIGTITPGTSGTITVNSAVNKLSYTRNGRIVYITGLLRPNFSGATIDYLGLQNGVQVVKYDVGWYVPKGQILGETQYSMENATTVGGIYTTPATKAGTLTGSSFMFTTIADSAAFNGGDRVNFALGGFGYVRLVDYLAATMILTGVSGATNGAQNVSQLQSNKRTTLWANAAPTTGTYEVGSRTIRQVPVVGQPKAWTCTGAGTPSTGVSEGNL